MELVYTKGVMLEPQYVLWVSETAFGNQGTVIATGTEKMCLEAMDSLLFPPFDMDSAMLEMQAFKAGDRLYLVRDSEDFHGFTQPKGMEVTAQRATFMHMANEWLYCMDDTGQGHNLNPADLAVQRPNVLR